jgi:hypothetical protein
MMFRWKEGRRLKLMPRELAASVLVVGYFNINQEVV